MKTPTLLMTAAIVLISALAVGPVEAAERQTRQMTVYLHDIGGLHIAPETYNANKGDTLQVTVRNDGQADHDLVFCADPASSSTTCRKPLAFTAVIEPGQSETLMMNLPDAGKFEFYCTLPGHKQGGMSGTLNVAGGEPETTRTVPAAGLVVGLAAIAGVALVRTRGG